MVPIIPLRHFFDNPEKAFAKLSPDGSRIAYLAPEEGRLNVWVKTIGLDDDHSVTHDRERPVISYFWSRDSKKILYLQDQGGNENTHVYAADPTQPDLEAKDLTPFDDVKVNIVDVPRETPNEILISMNKREAGLFDVHRLDLNSGKTELIAENPGNIVGWLTDAEGKLRAAVAQTPNGSSSLDLARTSRSGRSSSTTTRTRESLTRSRRMVQRCMWDPPRMLSTKGSCCST